MTVYYRSLKSGYKRFLPHLFHFISVIILPFNPTYRPRSTLTSMFLFVLFVFLALQPTVVYFPQPGSGISPRFRGFLITHNDAPQSVGLLWTSDHPSQRPLPDNTQHSQQTSMPPVGFEPTISAG